MINFKILCWVLRIFISVYLVAIAANIYVISFTSAAPSSLINNRCISAALMLLFATGLFFLERSCVMFIRRSYFNLKSALYLSRGGYIVSATAVLWICRSIINLDRLDKTEQIIKFAESISYNILILIIGFSLITLSDIVKKGENLKRENDLTI